MDVSQAEKEMQHLATLTTEQFTSNLPGRMQVVRELELTRLKLEAWVATLMVMVRSLGATEEHINKVYAQCASEVVARRRTELSKNLPTLETDKVM